jgi:23S rRNA (guanosine2251-2'-O)-methyltransferase
MSAHSAGSRLVCGIHAVRRALALGRASRIYVRHGLGAERAGRLAEGLARATVAVVEVPESELQRLAGTVKHQGILAEVRHSLPLSDREALAFIGGLDAPLLLVLDSIQDPRNFGSLLRTADAAGVDLVVTARSRNVGVTPVVSKVASGAAEVQPLAEVSNLARFMAQLGDTGVRIVGTDDQAEASLYDLDLGGALAIVMGAEGEGLRRLTWERCDQLVRIPMHGSVESLNVAVAAGVCLYECRRQRLHLAPAGGLR